MDESPRLSDFMLGLEGLAILRRWGEQEPILARRHEISRLVLGETDASLLKPIRFQEFEVHEGYAEFAKVYDEISNVVIDFEAPAVRSILAGIRPGRALDAACGTARHSAFLKGLGWDVIGVDRSPEMLTLAAANLPENSFAVGTIETLPLSDRSVDLAVCALALTHLADPTRAIVELGRVVRPGGRVVISDVHPFFISFGFHAFFGQGRFIRNHLHLVSKYFAALASADLRVVTCSEVPWSTESIAAQDWAQPNLSATLDALSGLPLVLVFEAERHDT